MEKTMRGFGDQATTHKTFFFFPTTSASRSVCVTIHTLANTKSFITKKILSQWLESRKPYTHTYTSYLDDACHLVVTTTAPFSILESFDSRQVAVNGVPTKNNTLIANTHALAQQTKK